MIAGGRRGGKEEDPHVPTMKDRRSVLIAECIRSMKIAKGWTAIASVAYAGFLTRGTVEHLNKTSKSTCVVAVVGYGRWRWWRGFGGLSICGGGWARGLEGSGLRELDTGGCGDLGRVCFGVLGVHYRMAIVFAGI